MEPIGPKIAEGRDSEIFDHGPGRVLRRARNQRSLVREAEVMAHARSHGYPVPEVFDAGDGYLVMERLEGPTLLDASVPFAFRRCGRTLADLHERLHRIPAPDWLTEVAPVDGDRLVHGDLHPLNVLVTADGPVVVDWANAARGDGAADVADAWLVMASGDPPTGRLEALLLPLARRSILGAFLRGIDRAAAEAALPDALERRSSDPNLSPSERDRMKSLVERTRG